MADVFKMPVLGQTMEEGTVVQWFKQEGDDIKVGDSLLEVMSDKANFEVESPFGGVLRKILVEADATVPVHEPIAIIGAAGESIDGLVGGASAAPAAAAAPSASAPVAAPQPAAVVPAASAPAVAGVSSAISPRARKLADQNGIDVALLAGKGTGPQGRIIERDVQALISEQPGADGARTRVSPLAAKIAEDLGVDVNAASTAGGRVMADDVRKLATAQKPAAPAVAPGGLTVDRVIPFKGLRKLIADNVTSSRHTAPHVMLTVEVDMTEAAALFAKLRPEILKAYDTKLTYTDLFVKAASVALADHPLCNAALVGDEIRLYSDKNIGVAVAAESGLIVPVIKHADAKRLGDISRELKELAERCRIGKQTQDDIAGGTFTITNLGAYGVDVFDPIIVPPQSCILGICRLVDKPVVIDKQVVVRSMMNLCLSFDHRVLDGAPAAKFLQRLKQVLETPMLMFV